MAATEPPKTSQKADEPKPTKTPRLAQAGQSTDPTVHQLLAERQGHEMNKAAALAFDQVAADEADAKIADVNRRLAELGYA